MQKALQRKSFHIMKNGTKMSKDKEVKLYKEIIQEPGKKNTENRAFLQNPGR